LFTDFDCSDIWVGAKPPSPCLAPLLAKRTLNQIKLQSNYNIRPVQKTKHTKQKPDAGAFYAIRPGNGLGVDILHLREPAWDRAKII